MPGASSTLSRDGGVVSSANTVLNRVMKQTAYTNSKTAWRSVISALIFCLLLTSQAQASFILSLSPSHTGNYWWTRNQWSGGIDTNDGFSYGASDSGLIDAQRLYYYYGGADRYFEAADIYFQIPLDSLIGMTVESVSLNFYVETLNTTAETFLKHLGSQTTAPTGDAAQKLAGTDDVFSSTNMALGWNLIDVTDSIVSDLDNGYAYAVFSIPRFAQVQDQNRLLSIYGASAADVGGTSVAPYLEVEVVPEPAAYGFLLGGLALCGGMFSRRRLRTR